jgi:hypothetical protein
MFDWLPRFFHDAFAAASPLGLAAFAMLVIVALVAVVVTISKGRPALIGIIAIVSVVGIVVFNQVFPPPPPLTHIEGRDSAPAPAPLGNSALWFDTGVQADWSGRDIFYGAGQYPVYEADGRKLCDDDHLGNVVTCWASRRAEVPPMAPGVPTNIREPRNDWCAYKSVTLAQAPDGHAPGRVYVCAHSIAR